jgi:hypothetical protein
MRGASGGQSDERRSFLPRRPFLSRSAAALLGREAGDMEMGVSDWIIRAAIFGVMAAAVIGTLLNLADALRKKKDRE